DVLGGCGVVDDEVCGAVGARPVLAKEGLEVRDRSSLSAPDSRTLASGEARHRALTIRAKCSTRSIRGRDLMRSRGRISGMKTLLALGLVTVCCLTFATAAGRPAGCSPLSCSPSQVPLSHGRLLAMRPDGVWGIVRVLDLRTGATRWRLPAGPLAGHLLVHQDGSLLTWFDVATGARVGDAMLQVRGSFSLVGSSQDGSRAVVARNQTRKTKNATFAIVSPHGQRVVVLGGNDWGFDALSGDKLYLLQYLK